MIQTWQFTNTTIGQPAPWWQRSGHCWGEIGSVTTQRETPGAVPQEYLIEGEWLGTAAIAADKRNTRKLGQKGIQARLDRLKAEGHLLPTRRRGEILHKATRKLTWADFTRRARTSNGVVRAGT